MWSTKSNNIPKETYFIHDKISKYEGRLVLILTDRKLYRG